MKKQTLCLIIIIIIVAGIVHLSFYENQAQNHILINNPIEITNIPADKFLMLLYTTV